VREQHRRHLHRRRVTTLANGPIVSKHGGPSTREPRTSRARLEDFSNWSSDGTEPVRVLLRARHRVERTTGNQ
jgi:hypothetical protein